MDNSHPTVEPLHRQIRYKALCCVYQVLVSVIRFLKHNGGQSIPAPLQRRRLATIDTQYVKPVYTLAHSHYGWSGGKTHFIRFNWNEYEQSGPHQLDLRTAPSSLRCNNYTLPVGECNVVL